MKRVATRAGVTVVDSVGAGVEAVRRLRALTGEVHACDTEVAGLDVRKESPVGNGKVVCFSVYCGPKVDFGLGPMMWVDTAVGSAAEQSEIMEVFGHYFRDNNIRKVWHNYSFDRHVLANHGIECRGFHADTLHMARLQNTARRSYSLESLSDELLGKAGKKITMAERFGRPNIKKDGSEGKLNILPDIMEIHTSPEMRESWIQYSALDAKITWEVYMKLKKLLSKMDWVYSESMLKFYDRYYKPFGELLTEMESTGIHVDVKALQEMEISAEAKLSDLKNEFLTWAESLVPGAKYMNIGSDAQKQQFFFAPDSAKSSFGLERVRSFSAPNTEGKLEPGASKPKKNFTFELSGLGLTPSLLSKSKKPSVCQVSLRDLCGFPRAPDPKYGQLAQKFPGEAGIVACKAVDSLLLHQSTSTLLETFIKPLQSRATSSQRIHCSLNLNTETGRLSSRRPNLQNQPALEKDIFGIRKAFCAGEGKTLIVCDYSQLELRILAHLTECKVMLDAFSSGGDLHSRTAVSMFPYVKERVDRQEVLVEPGLHPPELQGLPYVKDVFATERRKAKILNFSIAYGKTYRGLAQDWGVSVEEALDLLKRWYGDRPEVENWQKETIKEARKTKSCRTLMGRYRHLPDISSTNPSFRSHAERCAINSPIQGSAADIVMKAMLNIAGDKRLESMGWKILLQIHDELVLEGPQDSAEEALVMVKRHMEKPFARPLLVDLDVSSSIAQNWYEAK